MLLLTNVWNKENEFYGTELDQIVRFITVLLFEFYLKPVELEHATSHA
jgi:hypothetical protein